MRVAFISLQLQSGLASLNYADFQIYRTAKHRPTRKSIARSCDERQWIRARRAGFRGGRGVISSASRAHQIINKVIDSICVVATPAVRPLPSPEGVISGRRRRHPLCRNDKIISPLVFCGRKQATNRTAETGGCLFGCQKAPTPRGSRRGKHQQCGGNFGYKTRLSTTAPQNNPDSSWADAIKQLPRCQVEVCSPLFCQ